jgi:hypothetical protein
VSRCEATRASRSVVGAVVPKGPQRPLGRTPGRQQWV